jgi:hypothetical protein
MTRTGGELARDQERAVVCGGNRRHERQGYVDIAVIAVGRGDLEDVMMSHSVLPHCTRAHRAAGEQVEMPGKKKQSIVV